MREVLPGEEEANRASAGSGWEGNGKLEEEEGLSQEKTAQNREQKGVRMLDPGRKTGLADSAGLRCGLGCPSLTKVHTRSGPDTGRARRQGAQCKSRISKHDFTSPCEGRYHGGFPQEVTSKPRPVG